MNKVENYLVGSDPELFIRHSQTNKIISSIGLIPRVKGKAYTPEGMSKGYGLQIDNILAEFNIPPTNIKADFIASMNKMKKFIDDFVKKTDQNYEIHCYGSAIVDDDQLQSKEAKEFGCSPDYNAWTEDINPKPDGESTNLRTTGCHFHIGYDNPSVEISLEIVKAFDLFLGVPSILIDPDDRRRQLYGKAGCFRLTSYGVEYRTLSGYFISSDKLIGYCFDQIGEAIDFINKGNSAEMVREEVQHCINNNDKEAAKALVSKFNLKTI